jgi:hypothetical protein
MGNGYIDEDDVARLRAYAARLERQGNSTLASLWREMADRVETSASSAAIARPVSGAGRAHAMATRHS